MKMRQKNRRVLMANSSESGWRAGTFFLGYAHVLRVRCCRLRAPVAAASPLRRRTLEVPV